MNPHFETQREICEARAGVYRFLAQLYSRPPTPELMEKVAEAEFQHYLREVFGEAAQSFLDAVAACPHLEALRLEYDALFRVPGDRYLCPYESAYRGRRVVDGRVVYGPVWGPWARRVQNLYGQAGAELVREGGELPDFIGVEFEFMHFLCTREAEAWATAEPWRAEQYRSLQKEFLVEHLSRWVDSLADEMVVRAELGFYAALAELTKAFLVTDIQGTDSQPGRLG